MILPHSLPGIIDVARINLAAAWLMLVVAELLGPRRASATGSSLSQRFRQVDRMFAILLIVFGFIGLVSDLVLRRVAQPGRTVGPAVTTVARRTPTQSLVARRARRSSWWRRVKVFAGRKTS